MNSAPDADESAFDAQLRARLTDFNSSRPLPAGGLADVRARLAAAVGAPIAPKPAGRARPFAGGVVVGVLLMLAGWWGRPALPRHATQDAPPVAHIAPAVHIQPPSTIPSDHAVISDGHAVISDGHAVISDDHAVISDDHAVISDDHAVISHSPATISHSPATISVAGDSARSAALATEGRLAPTRVLSPRWARAFALDTTLRRALAQPAADTSRAADAARRAHLTALLAEQAVALTILQTSIDSLKASLSEVPPALPVAAADSTVLPDAAPDAWRHLPPARSAWAVAALLETTPGWATAPVRAAGADAEQTQRSLTQSIQLQRQLTPRWLVRGGIGITQTQTQTSRTSERSGTTTVRDSVLTTTVSIRITTSTSQIVRVDPVLHVEPLVNLSGQIIGYDTTWRFTADTLLIPLINRDTLRQTRTVVTARTTQWREARQQLFRPTYRFWTLPVAVQFQALRTDRWTLGATVGGQLSVFRSGETPVRVADGYELRRVSARDSPYRPVSLSFSAGLEATYRLSPRLSALVAPTLRGWLVPPGRAGTRTQRLLPALQVGLTYGL